LAEVSGQGFLEFWGDIDLSANRGQIGTLLLDPTNITIVEGPNNPPDLPSGGGSQLLFGNNPGGDSTVNNGTINAALADVILQVTNDITFSAPITITAANVGLTAQAGNNIFVNSTIETRGGNVTLNADVDGLNGGSLTISNATINTNGGNFVGIGRGNALSPVGVIPFWVICA
jgi:hypothetical protein